LAAEVNRLDKEVAAQLVVATSEMVVHHLLAGPRAVERDRLENLSVDTFTIDGDHLTRQLTMSMMSMGCQRRPSDWVPRDGEWTSFERLDVEHARKSHQESRLPL
jgi:hypothetical protein